MKALLILAILISGADEESRQAPDPERDDRPAATHPCEEGAESVEDCAPPGEPVPDEAQPDLRADQPPPATPIEEPVAPGPEIPVDPPADPSPPAHAVSAAAPLAAGGEPVAQTAEEPSPDPRVEEPPASPPSAEDATTADAPPVKEGLGFGVIPTPNFNSDDGFGMGVLGSLYWYEDGVEPYRYALTLLLFVTTNLVMDHQLRFDAIDVAGLPLRFTFRGGYYQSLTQNFCGYGNQVTCDVAEARKTAASLGLTGERAAEFERRFYFVRFLRPYASGLLRWRLNDKPHKIELMAGWRGHWYIPGSPFADDDGDGSPDFELTVYPNSFYARSFPQGEPGIASVFQVGAMIDDRDNEAAPTRGYWIEGSVRGAHLLTGSTWDYIGANLTARGYLPLLRYGDEGHAVVAATRLVLDATAGDLPVQEMIRVGGSWDYTAFGGNPMGRGIRVQRYIGRIKALQQVELRADFLSHELFGQQFKWTAVSFVDAGWIGVDWTDFGGDPLELVMGVGGGLRFAWEENFVIKLDLATSSVEGWPLLPPAIYFDIGHTF